MTASERQSAPGKGTPAANDAAVVAVEVKSFKYHDQIKQLIGCPPRDFADYPCGYRFCTADIKNEKNFFPVAFIDTERTICCSSYALSMFVDLDSLVDKARRLSKTFKNFNLKFGDHYAKVNLSAAAGRCTKRNSQGHFDFFEYSAFDPVTAITEHSKRPA